MFFASARVIVDGMQHRTPATAPLIGSAAIGHPSTQKMHVAVILDGNGRWATARGLPRSAGHQQGTRTVRHCVRAASGLGIGTLTLYAFSSDNWQRPVSEVSFLMRLLDGFLRRESAQCVKHGIRVSVIGRRDRLPPALVEGIERIEAETAGGRELHVRLAIDYSAREAIWYAAECAIRTGVSSREQFAWAVRSGRGTPAHVSDVDLLIRTGGERRLSDFLLWELAYAELYFTDTMWPDFRREDLEAALDWFRTRQRRFGHVAADLTPESERPLIPAIREAHHLGNARPGAGGRAGLEPSGRQQP
jgi:undecaprenyl diphosphate synthase